MKRDFFFEFAGMPKAGKTTILEIVAHFLKRQGYRIRAYDGEGRYAPIDKTSLASLNLFLAGKAIEFVLLSSERDVVHPRIHLLDKGIFDRCIFTRALLNVGEIDGHESNALVNYLTLPRLTQRIDCVYLFVTTPELSIARELENKLISEQGPIINHDFLKILREACFHDYQNLQGSFRAIELIDTAQQDGEISQSAQKVVDSILKVIAINT